MKNIMKKGLVSLVTAAAIVGATAPSIAQAPSPEDRAAGAVETRRAVFKLLGFNMGPMGGMLRGQVDFDADVIKANAASIAALGKLISPTFAMDTREFDVKTEALDSVWGAKGAFDTKAMDMVAAAEALIVAANSGNEGAIKAAIGGVGKTCGACHDDFRLDD